MKKIILLLSLTLFFVSCTSNNPNTPEKVVKRFTTNKEWLNMADYLAPYLSSVTTTMGQDFAQNDKNGKFTFRLQEQTADTAYVAAEYKSDTEKLNLYFELRFEEGKWKLYSVVGMPQSPQSMAEFDNIQKVLAGDQDLQAKLEEGLASSPLRFTLQQQLKNIGYIAALDSNLVKDLQQQLPAIETLIQTAQDQNTGLAFAAKESDFPEVAQQLANLGFIAIDTLNPTEDTTGRVATILVAQSLDTLIFIMQQTDGSVLPTLGNDIMAIEPLSDNLFIIKTMLNYNAPAFQPEGDFTDIPLPE